LCTSASQPTQSHRCWRNPYMDQGHHLCRLYHIYDFFIICITLHILVLTTMAYDCVVSIAHHLHYKIITSPRLWCCCFGYSGWRVSSIPSYNA
jgi:hypothetical protein